MAHRSDVHYISILRQRYCSDDETIFKLVFNLVYEKRCLVGRVLSGLTRISLTLFLNLWTINYFNVFTKRTVTSLSHKNQVTIRVLN